MATETQAGGSIVDTMQPSPVMPPETEGFPVPAPSSPRRKARHGATLSLNFPILLPNSTTSPATSPRPASPSSSRASPRIKAVTFTATPALTSPVNSSTEFLTLVAAQERKVLELREELNRAEHDLASLKKRWSRHEAHKKKEEVRHSRRMPVPLDDVSHSPKLHDEAELEEERKRRRALVELSNNAAGQGQRSQGLGRQRSQRKVFEGRHTRTLSLLSPTTPRRSQDTASLLDEHVEDCQNTQELETRSVIDQPPQLSRMPTLDGLVSPEMWQTGVQAINKTSREIAAQHRKSLPPGAVDMMRQGRSVVEGVKEGFWAFYEDIKQATVGDEAIYGASMEQQQRLRGQSVKVNRAVGDRTATAPKQTTGSGTREESFWQEFGLDTPGRSTVPSDKPQRAKPRRDVMTKKGRGAHHAHVPKESDSSTSSQVTPDLLTDSPSTSAASREDEELDHWDNWESPSPSHACAGSG